jgi:hypothetical protein
VEAGDLVAGQHVVFVHQVDEGEVAVGEAAALGERLGDAAGPPVAGSGRDSAISLSSRVPGMVSPIGCEQRKPAVRASVGRPVTSEASPRTAEVVVELAGDVAVGWGQAGGLS